MSLYGLGCPGIVVEPFWCSLHVQVHMPEGSEYIINSYFGAQFERNAVKTYFGLFGGPGHRLLQERFAVCVVNVRRCWTCCFRRATCFWDHFRTRQGSKTRYHCRNDSYYSQRNVFFGRALGFPFVSLGILIALLVFAPADLYYASWRHCASLYRLNALLRIAV